MSAVIEKYANFRMQKPYNFYKILQSQDIVPFLVKYTFVSHPCLDYARTYLQQFNGRTLSKIPHFPFR